MTIQGSVGAAEVRRGYPAQPFTPQTVLSEETEAARSAARETNPRRFDRVTISGGERFGSYELEARGRIEREVRTATSSGQIAALREQVRGGTYRPDPAAIARKMLLLGEDG